MMTTDDVFISNGSVGKAGLGDDETDSREIPTQFDVQRRLWSSDADSPAHDAHTRSPQKEKALRDLFDSVSDPSNAFVETAGMAKLLAHLIPPVPAESRFQVRRRVSEDVANKVIAALEARSQSGRLSFEEFYDSIEMLVDPSGSPTHFQNSILMAMLYAVEEAGVEKQKERDSDMKQKDIQIDELRDEIEQLRQEMEEMDTSNRALLDEADVNIEQLQEENCVLRAQITDARTHERPLSAISDESVDSIFQTKRSQNTSAQGSSANNTQRPGGINAFRSSYSRPTLSRAGSLTASMKRFSFDVQEWEDLHRKNAKSEEKAKGLERELFEARGRIQTLEDTLSKQQDSLKEMADQKHLADEELLTVMQDLQRVNAELKDMRNRRRSTLQSPTPHAALDFELQLDLLQSTNSELLAQNAALQQKITQLQQGKATTADEFQRSQANATDDDLITAKDKVKKLEGQVRSFEQQLQKTHAAAAAADEALERERAAAKESTAALAEATQKISSAKAELKQLKLDLEREGRKAKQWRDRVAVLKKEGRAVVHKLQEEKGRRKALEEQVKREKALAAEKEREAEMARKKKKADLESSAHAPESNDAAQRKLTSETDALLRKELEAAQADLATLKEASAKEIESLKSTHADTVAAMTSSLDSLQKRVSALVVELFEEKAACEEEAQLREDAERERDDRVKDIEELEEMVTQLQEEVATLKHGMQQDTASAEAEAARKKRTEALRAALREKESELGALRSAHTALQDKLAELQLERRARADGASSMPLGKDTVATDSTSMQTSPEGPRKLHRVRRRRKSSSLASSVASAETTQIGEAGHAADVVTEERSSDLIVSSISQRQDALAKHLLRTGRGHQERNTSDSSPHSSARHHGHDTSNFLDVVVSGAPQRQTTAEGQQRRQLEYNDDDDDDDDLLLRRLAQRPSVAEIGKTAYIEANDAIIDRLAQRIKTLEGENKRLRKDLIGQTEAEATTLGELSRVQKQGVRVYKIQKEGAETRTLDEVLGKISSLRQSYKREASETQQQLAELGEVLEGTYVESCHVRDTLDDIRSTIDHKVSEGVFDERLEDGSMGYSDLSLRHDPLAYQRDVLFGDGSREEGEDDDSGSSYLLANHSPTASPIPAIDTFLVTCDPHDGGSRFRLTGDCQLIFTQNDLCLTNTVTGTSSAWYWDQILRMATAGPNVVVITAETQYGEEIEFVVHTLQAKAIIGVFSSLVA